MNASAQPANHHDPEARLRTQVLKEYRANELTVQEIARKHRVGTGRVIKWAQEANLKRQRGRPRIDESVIQAALRDLKRGAGTLQEIAERHDISSRTLRSRAKEAKLTTSTQREEAARYERIKPDVLHDYQHSPLSLNAIAKKHGISSSTIGNWAAEAGLKRGRRSNRQFERREPVLQDYRESGLTLREIAKKHDVSETSIRNWVKQAKAVRQVEAVPPRARARQLVLDAYQAGGKTVREIAEEYGVSQSSVNKWAREEGLTRRNVEKERLEKLRPQILHAYTTTPDSIAQIAKRFDVHKSTVHRYAKQAGLTEANRPMSRRKKP